MSFAVLGWFSTYISNNTDEYSTLGDHNKTLGILPGDVIYLALLTIYDTCTYQEPAYEIAFLRPINDHLLKDVRRPSLDDDWESVYRSRVVSDLNSVDLGRFGLN